MLKQILGDYSCTAGNIYGKAEAKLLLTGKILIFNIKKINLGSHGRSYILSNSSIMEK